VKLFQPGGRDHHEIAQHRAEQDFKRHARASDHLNKVPMEWETGSTLPPSVGGEENAIVDVPHDVPPTLSAAVQLPAVPLTTAVEVVVSANSEYPYMLDTKPPSNILFIACVSSHTDKSYRQRELVTSTPLHPPPSPLFTSLPAQTTATTAKPPKLPTPSNERILPPPPPSPPSAVRTRRFARHGCHMHGRIMEPTPLPSDSL
jgi:hypothetical protein